MKYLAMILAGVGIIACAQLPTSEVEREAAMQPARPMHGELAAKGLDAIDDSKLTSAQKEALKSIHFRMVSETFRAQEETSQLKGVLFETITKAPYDAKKVEAIKQKIVTLNDKKINSMFWALNEVEKVLGHADPEQKQDIYQSLFFKDEDASLRARCRMKRGACDF